MYVVSCICVRVCVSKWEARRVLESLGLEVVVGCLTWVL